MMNKSLLAPLFDPAQGMLFQRGGLVFLLFVLVFLFGATHAADAQPLKKIRIASKGSGEPLLAYIIPQRLGFYREEGLDPEVIVTRGTVTTQVVISGAVDYSNGGSIPAILAGARLKILLINTDKPAQYLVSSAKITSIKQLSGKTVAISDSAGNSTLLLYDLLKKNGVPIDSVRVRALGEQALRFGALLSGAVDATTISYSLVVPAQTKGFHILAYTGDYVAALSANLETTDDKIRNVPDEVYKVVKATLKGQMFFHRNPNEAVKFIIEVLRLNDPNEAREIWAERTKQASEIAKMGRASEEAMVANIERVREQMRMANAPTKVKGPVSLDQVYDFSFVKRAYEEIRASKWDASRYEYVRR
jgi:ABC-type nitrate/sulfonate/bicarbonate transport system substrate-binding protein